MAIHYRIKLHEIPLFGNFQARQFRRLGENLSSAL